MATLTKRQKQLLDYLNAYIGQFGYAPTLAEIGSYFGLSSLGDTPTQDNKVSQRGIQPYRVADPFLWELGGFGAIKVKKGS